MINHTQLSFTYNSHGYMLTYKEKPIGGAGVSPSGKRRNGAMVKADLLIYRESAQQCIKDIKDGRGQKRFLTQIINIDKG